VCGKKNRLFHERRHVGQKVSSSHDLPPETRLIETMTAVLGFALCGYVCILAVGDVWLAIIHLRFARAELARERRLPRLAVVDSALPMVCIQLPIFNEAQQIAPALEALCLLDWPRDRLEIMVLDDSTDATSAIAQGETERWRARGISIIHVRRAHRQDFKAGALAAGMALTTAAYLAIFDADYRPGPCFLRDTMGPLLKDDTLAFVQARLDYRNRTHNLLTRAQALDLDTLLAYEQAARSWAGVPLTFNGTCGVWRRQAIEDAGGWSGASLAEDQDLSLRAYERGWRSRYLVSVAAAGELPERFDVLVTQRQRWSSGTAQTFRGLPWRILGQLRASQAIPFVLLTLFYATVSPALVLAMLTVATAWLLGASQAPGLSAMLLVAFAAVVVPKSIGAALASRALGRPIGIAFALDLAGLWAMQAALLPIGAAALARGYLFRRLAFLRTPKSQG